MTDRESEDPQSAPQTDPAQWLAYLMTRKNAAFSFASRCTDALEAAARAEKALATVTRGDIGGFDGDIGGDTEDALTELRAAGTRLRNAMRIADLHERAIADEIVKAQKEMPHG